ncbi:M23 family metallopeptidase [Govanella unica]|uniref:M23 family metallopeptidase n=1 Tax=Govanella unica TaxID=2975056 RepID=A0A9X3TV00_9PROT|nr:M23 family metallopeptidase [Govania unica]MDA5192340.1 M23 family metallopeptidase [Govania unica]
MALHKRVQGNEGRSLRVKRRLAPLVAPAAIALLAGFGLFLAKVGSDDSTSPEETLAFAPTPVLTANIPVTNPQVAESLSEDVTIGRGETFIGALTSAGVSREDAHNLLAAIRPHFNPRQMQIGQAMTLTFAREKGFTGSRKGRIESVSFDADLENRVVANLDQNVWNADVERTPLSRVALRTGGTIDNSLFLSAKRQNVPQTVIAELIRIFSYDVDFQRDIKEGDSFELYYDRHVSKDGKKARDGNILFAKMTLSGKPITLYRYQEGGEDRADYFHENGKSVKKSLLKTPIDGARLTSGFGSRRHPVLGYTKVHKGVDFGAATGTPIMAAGDGVIERAGPFSSYGNYVRVRHTNSYSTAYAHMSRVAAGISPGTRVRQGQVIGYVGTTGRSTGPHLHYEVLAANTQVNPLSLKLPTGRELGGRQLASFKTYQASLHTEIAALPLNSQVAMADLPKGSPSAGY